MKKLTLILSVLMLLSVLALTACDPKTPDETKESDTVAETPAESVTEAATESETEAATESQKVTYTVTVKDQDGNPVAGVRVQLCEDDLCKLPKSTNENGVAAFEEAEGVYRAKLASLPEGYTGDLETYHPFDGKTELTITVTKG